MHDDVEPEPSGAVASCVAVSHEIADRNISAMGVPYDGATTFGHDGAARSRDAAKRTSHRVSS
jgi:hypothetical protein